MQITKISVGKSVEALGHWHKANIEASLDEGEDKDKVYFELRRIIDRWLPSENDGSKIYINPEYAHLLSENQNGFPITADQKISGMQELINLCSSKVLLERQRKQVERLKNPELTQLFNDKLNSFE